MDPELKRYMNAIVILLSLNIGFLVTSLWVSPAVYRSDLFVPPAIGAIVVGGFVWLLTGFIDR